MYNGNESKCFSIVLRRLDTKESNQYLIKCFPSMTMSVFLRNTGLGINILFINWSYIARSLVKKINTRLAFVYYPNGNEMDQMVRNDIACNCIPIVRIAFRTDACISFQLLF